MLTGGVRRARAVIVGDGKGWVVAVQEAVLQGVGGLAAIGGGSPAAAGWWVKSGCIFLVYRRGKRKEWVASAGGRQSARIDGAGRVRARRGVLPLQPAAGGWWDELTTLRQRASWRVKAASAAVVWLVCAMGGRRTGNTGWG